MKTFFTLALLFSLSLSGFAQKEIISGPAISLDKDTHDYGTIKLGADGNCQFTVTNIGTEPLIISNCQGTCGCTVPQCDKAPIMPGQTSVIKVAYDTKRVGPFTKGVTISSNAVNESSKMINITGTVEGDSGAGSAPVRSNPGLTPINK